MEKEDTLGRIRPAISSSELYPHVVHATSGKNIALLKFNIGRISEIKRKENTACIPKKIKSRGLWGRLMHVYVQTSATNLPDRFLGVEYEHFVTSNVGVFNNKLNNCVLTQLRVVEKVSM